MSTIGASAAAGVLVVEDDGDLREALAECLRFEGYDVVEAVDGADALARLRRGARPALIILDLVMPRMDGRQLLAAMRVDADLAGIPVVLATGNATTGPQPRGPAGPAEADRSGRPLGVRAAVLRPRTARHLHGAADAAAGIMTTSDRCSGAPLPDTCLQNGTVLPLSLTDVARPRSRRLEGSRAVDGPAGSRRSVGARVALAGAGAGPRAALGPEPRAEVSGPGAALLHSVRSPAGRSRAAGGEEKRCKTCTSSTR